MATKAEVVDETRFNRDPTISRKLIAVRRPSPILHRTHGPKLNQRSPTTRAKDIKPNLRPNRKDRDKAKRRAMAKAKVEVKVKTEVREKVRNRRAT